MPKYDIQHPDGRIVTVEGDTPPTEQDMDAIFAQVPAKGPSMMRKAAELVTTTVRGLRGAGVTTQRLIEGDGLAKALDRGAEAVKPGYQPAPGEKIGAAAGEVAATAPFLAATGGGGLWAQALKGGLSSGAMTAVMEASERGDVQPMDVVTSSTLGGTVPVIGPTLKTIARAVRGIGKGATTAGTSLTTEAVDELYSDPKLLDKFKGTAESVGEKVKEIQTALMSHRDEAGEILNAARKKIGFREKFSDSVRRVQAEGFKPPTIQEILDDFKVLSTGKIKTEVVRDARRVVEKKGVLSSYEPGEGFMEYESVTRNIPASKTVREVALPPKARLRDLIRLREKVDDLINYPAASADVPKIGSADQAFLKELRGKINKIIWNPKTGKGIPGGEEQRAADEVYSSMRDLYDDFQKKIATQGKAEDVVRRIVMGGDVDDVIGARGEFMRTVREIEKKRGVKLIEPAKKEILARDFRTIQQSKGSTYGALPAAMGTGGVSGLLQVVNGISKVPEFAAAPLASKGLRGAIQAALAQRMREPR